jgi:lipopolysaccharide transport system ATP-binding protein
VSGEPLIVLDRASVRYRKSARLTSRDYAYALNSISFSVHAGETLGVIGKNGSGKSSLLRLLARIIEPDDGKVDYHTPRILLLSLQVNFLPSLSGRENAIISGMLMGMRRRHVESVMDQIVEYSGLGEHIEQQVRTYSSGMRARLGFAVAQQADPDVLLLDEVLSVGDADFRAKSKVSLEQRIRSNHTVVIVSHNEDTIKNYCDRVIFIDQGTVKAIGNPEHVIKVYKDCRSGE